MQVDYKDIGARIRSEREKQDWDQAQLAHMANLSVTHMSHVETGTTKVSLPSLVSIANALNVSLDTLVCGSTHGVRQVFETEIAQCLNACNEYELRVISDTIKSLWAILQKHE